MLEDPVARQGHRRRHFAVVGELLARLQCDARRARLAARHELGEAGDRVVALVVAAGAAWESRALGLLEEHPDLTVLKRCVDADDLLASASTGQADVAVVALAVELTQLHVCATSSAVVAEADYNNTLQLVILLLLTLVVLVISLISGQTFLDLVNLVVISVMVLHLMVHSLTVDLDQDSL